MVARVNQRRTFGKLLSEQGVVIDWIARARIQIDASRLIVLNAADKIDRGDAKAAMAEIGMAKILVPTMACKVLDQAIQAHGAGGISQDFPLARIWAYLRTTRLADGPDEVHIMQLGRGENKRHRQWYYFPISMRFLNMLTTRESIEKIEMQNAKMHQLKKQYKIPPRSRL